LRVTASADKTARVWNAATGQLLAKLEAHDGPVFHAAFSPDGHRIVTASADNARVYRVLLLSDLVRLLGKQKPLETTCLFGEDA